MILDITTGAQTVTGTGPVTGTLDTSAMTGAFMLKLDVQGLGAGAVARIAIEDTASASAFSDAEAVVVFDVCGQIQSIAPVSMSVRGVYLPSARFGAANTKFRVNVLSLLGNSPSLTLHASLVQ